jgi:hypothetical protein
MPIDLRILCRELKPEGTALLFGAGSSIPSGAPSGGTLSQRIANQFEVNYDSTLTLADIATLIELRHPRKELVEYVDSLLEKLAPTKGLLNLPLFDWKFLFTTNYDTLIERAYKKACKALRVYSSNFDFGDGPAGVELFKIHGTLGQDRSLGHQASMVLTNEDYEHSQRYRELVFDRLLHETSRNDVLIVGHTLADPDLAVVLKEAIRRKKASGAPGTIYALIFSEDANRATLFEKRGSKFALAAWMTSLPPSKRPRRMRGWYSPALVTCWKAALPLAQLRLTYDTAWNTRPLTFFGCLTAEQHAMATFGAI